jgi:hypothetical protein
LSGETFLGWMNCASPHLHIMTDQQFSATGFSQPLSCSWFTDEAASKKQMNMNLMQN